MTPGTASRKLQRAIDRPVNPTPPRLFSDARETTRPNFGRRFNAATPTPSASSGFACSRRGRRKGYAAIHVRRGRAHEWAWGFYACHRSNTGSRAGGARGALRAGGLAAQGRSILGGDKTRGLSHSGLPHGQGADPWVGAEGGSSACLAKQPHSAARDDHPISRFPMHGALGASLKNVRVAAESSCSRGERQRIDAGVLRDVRGLTGPEGERDARNAVRVVVSRPIAGERAAGQATAALIPRSNGRTRKKWLASNPSIECRR